MSVREKITIEEAVDRLCATIEGGKKSVKAICDSIIRLKARQRKKK